MYPLNIERVNSLNNKPTGESAIIEYAMVFNLLTLLGLNGLLLWNDENSLSCVLTLAYLSARDTYRVEREEKCGKGYADFTFHPRRKNDTAFIVELKKDENPDVAIKQIIEKEYVEKLRKENKGKKVLAVAICYDSKTKEHSCKIERINLDN